MSDQATQQQEAVPEELSKSSHWRNLESSRDSWKSKAEKWRDAALRGHARQQGLDPEKGVGKLLLKNFSAEQDVDPDQLEDAFTAYAEEHGIEFPGGEEGGQQNGDGQPSEAEQLMDQKQGETKDLRDMSKPPGGDSDKPLNQQIADLEAAGEFEKAEDLSFQLAAQQYVQNQQQGAQRQG